MRHALTIVLAACGGTATTPEPPSRGGPFVIVDKLEVQRQIELDETAFAAFAGGEQPTTFLVTMTVFKGEARDELDAIFHREYRDGVWFSSSPSEGVIVDETPR